MDQEMKKRCIKITVLGVNNIGRPEIHSAVAKEMDKGESAIEFFYRLEKPREHFMVLDREETAAILSAIGKVNINKDTDLQIDSVDQQKTLVRVHWLPPFIHDDYLHDIFRDYGQVTAIEHEFDATLNTNTCVRRIRMVVTEEEKTKIPHLISYGMGKRLLVTMAGRAPICLKCHELGHIRSSCPKNQPKHNQQEAENIVRNSSPRGAELLTYAETLRSTLREKGFIPNKSPIPTAVSVNDDTEVEMLEQSGPESDVSGAEWQTQRSRANRKSTRSPSPPQQKRSKTSHTKVDVVLTAPYDPSDPPPELITTEDNIVEDLTESEPGGN